MTDNQTRNDMIKSVHLKAADNRTGDRFPSSYVASSGTGLGGETSPVFGAMFAPMALNLPIKIVLGSAHSRSNGKYIAGGVVGGVAVIVLFAFTVIYMRRHQRKQGSERQEQDWATETHTVAPYSYTVPNGSVIGGTDPTPGVLIKNEHVHISAPTLRKFPGNFNTLRRNHVTEHAQSAALQPSHPTAPDNLAHSDDVNVRAELEQLRRTVEEMRASGGTMGYDSPPEYQARSRASSL